MMKRVFTVMLAMLAVAGGVVAIPADINGVETGTSITVSAYKEESYFLKTGDVWKQRYEGELKITNAPSGLAVCTSYNTSTKKTLLTITAKNVGTYSFTGTLSGVSRSFIVTVSENTSIATGTTLLSNFNKSVKSVQTSNNNVLHVSIPTAEQVRLTTAGAGKATIKVLFQDGSTYITTQTVTQKYVQKGTRTVRLHTRIKYGSTKSGYKVAGDVLSVQEYDGGYMVTAEKKGNGTFYLRDEYGTYYVYKITVVEA